jgi:signal transduction histidine kinase
VLVQQLGDVLTGRLRVPVDLVVQDDGQPPVDVKLACYRIAQEAFNNIAKHAEATRVSAKLRCATEVVELTIVDDGHGFDPEANCPGCLGLSIMAERAESMGALLQIESQPSQGTRIHLSWPAT